MRSIGSATFASSAPLRRAVLSAVPAAALLAVMSADASAFVAPTTWARGAGTTVYGGWDFFNSPGGPNAPDLPGKYPAGQTYPGAITPNAYDTDPATSGAFVTGGGNIYSFGAPTHINVDVPGYNTGAGSLTTVILQLRTQGSEAVYTGENGVRLTYAGTGGPTTIYPVGSKELARTALGGFGGALVDTAFVFHLPTDPANFKLIVDSSSSSMSLDQIYVDTAVTSAATGFLNTPVPEPTTAAVLGLGAVGLLARRRRQGGRA